MQELAIVQHIKNRLKEKLSKQIPIGISNKHLHLSKEDFDKLFPNKELRVKKWLAQPGEFAAEEAVSVLGPKGEIKNVRIIGPIRKITQIELALTDARMLGIKPPIRLSGDLSGAAPITLRSPFGEVTVNAAIVAKRHVHMTTTEASILDLKQGDVIKVAVNTIDRKTIFDDVDVRVNDNYSLELHLDTDEANAANIADDTVGIIL